MALRLAGYRSHTEPNGENYLGVCGIGNETTVSGHDRWPIDRRQVVARRQRYDGRAVISHEGVWCDKQGTAWFLAKRVNDCFNIGVAVNWLWDRRNIE